MPNGGEPLESPAPEDRLTALRCRLEALDPLLVTLAASLDIREGRRS